MSEKQQVSIDVIEQQRQPPVTEKKNAGDQEQNDKSVTYLDGFKEETAEEDHISIESETNERVLREPPDGGRAWLVLVGCFCVSFFCCYCSKYGYFKINLFLMSILQGLFCT